MDSRLLKLREEAKSRGEPILREQSFWLLLETVKNKKPKSILEIGVNLGLSGIAMLLTEKQAHLTGIEIDEEKIRLARGNYQTFGVEDNDCKVCCKPIATSS